MMTLAMTLIMAATTPTTEKMATAATAFLDALSPEQRAKAALGFDIPERTDWHWIPKPYRKGLMIREMTPAQREKAMALLSAGLSPEGFAKANAIFHLESVLDQTEKKREHLRDPERYYWTIFGEPGEKGTWGYSVEGHHFSANYVIRDGQLVSSTPTFLGANPRWMTADLAIGPPKGTKTLDKEERLAYELFSSLSPELKKKAWVSKGTPKHLVAGPPSSFESMPPVGLKASAMSEDERKALRAIIAVYASSVTQEAGAARMKRVDEDGLDKARFAWFGADKIDQPHFFRIEGPSFIIELENTQTDPLDTPANHIHSVWRDPIPATSTAAGS